MTTKAYLRYAVQALKPRRFYYLASATARDFLKKGKINKDSSIHIQAAMEWLSYAQKQNRDGGVSALYSLFDGWAPSYVETTGYIIPTFFNYAELSKNGVYRQEAIEMAEFELRKQLESGAFPGAGSDEEPIVFNTGQVLFGLCRAYEETKDEKYRQATIKASDWIVSAMDDDGCWRRHEYLNNVHTYNTRTAWALLCAHRITGRDIYKKTAERNIDWALDQQQKSGWFRNNGFYPEQEPLVHTIAYSIRGILESSIYLRKKIYLEAAIKPAASMADAQRHDGSLSGSFNNEWKSSVTWSCLTGNSQMSIIWQKLSIITKDKRFEDAAQRSNSYMKKMQDLDSENRGIRGGIPGASPIFGWYAPFSFPNWAAKFFVDALMLEMDPQIHPKIM